MKELELDHGNVAMVDDWNYERLSQWRWRTHTGSQITYAGRSGPWVNGKKKGWVLLHREIANPPVGVEIDHRDGNGLNNLESNLRLATRTENAWNTGPGSRSKTGYKGVLKQRRGFAVRCHGFKTAEEAARAYDLIARIAQGEFAYLNFPDETGSSL